MDILVLGALYFLINLIIAEYDEVEYYSNCKIKRFFANKYLVIHDLKNLIRRKKIILVYIFIIGLLIVFGTIQTGLFAILLVIINIYCRKKKYIIFSEIVLVLGFVLTNYYLIIPSIGMAIFLPQKVHVKARINKVFKFLTGIVINLIMLRLFPESYIWFEFILISILLFSTNYITSYITSNANNVLKIKTRLRFLILSHSRISLRYLPFCKMTGSMGDMLLCIGYLLGYVIVNPENITRIFELITLVTFSFLAVNDISLYNYVLNKSHLYSNLVLRKLVEIIIDLLIFQTFLIMIMQQLVMKL